MSCMTPTATVIHMANLVQRNPAGITMLYHYRNNILTYFKYLPLLHALIYLLWGFVMSGYRMTRYRQPHYFLWANFHILYFVPQILLRRRTPVSQSTVYKMNGLLSFPVLLSEYPDLAAKKTPFWQTIQVYLQNISKVL